MPREVITLQLGNYANYVGAHYWNIQVGSTHRHILCRIKNGVQSSIPPTPLTWNLAITLPTLWFDTVCVQSQHLSHASLQDELLGLAESPEWRDTAGYTDPDVLFRTGETSQVHPQSTCAPCTDHD